jgi:hypothetical protein
VLGLVERPPRVIGVTRTATAVAAETASAHDESHEHHHQPRLTGKRAKG